MPLPQITRDDVQQLPDDGNRHEAIAGEPRPARVATSPPVHHGDEQVGEIDLTAVFAED
ncbi:MAG: hypothetical protein R3195_14435 [Gemmatimonadota bacterium]|nr:hypothetical protein [Gemmatimonadota bacterium]